MSNETDLPIHPEGYHREGSVTTPQGFMAGTATCGLKSSGGPDLALVVSKRDCSAAGVFTQNQFAAAPVTICRETLARHPNKIRAVVANAGVANACTGQAGVDTAHQMQEVTSEALDCTPDQVLVLSTGIIGEALDMQIVRPGIHLAADDLSDEGGVAAAHAIMTTDTIAKHASLGVELSKGRVMLGGIAKGAGMIHPDMATMLALITTDAMIMPEAASDLLRSAVEDSFNSISVDGDTSTNDSVILLANGASGVGVQSEKDRQAFAEALMYISQDLAKMIVRDGEGATKFVTLHVSGARDVSEARTIGRTIVTSPLVKTALHGGDPNWGRVLAAVGRAGVSVDPDRISLSASAPGQRQTDLVEGGVSAMISSTNVYEIFSSPELTLELDLGDGFARATFWTCDLSEEYVEFNSEYHT
jgi:glutamate N-acetyltransferase/amino-acid N-acetyltransferase